MDDVFEEDLVSNVIVLNAETGAISAMNVFEQHHQDQKNNNNASVADFGSSVGRSKNENAKNTNKDQAANNGNKKRQNQRRRKSRCQS